jgi:hypothetical protein
MKRSTLTFGIAALATVTAFGAFAKPGDDDKPGRGPRPAGSLPRPAASMVAHPRGSADAADVFRRARREAQLKRLAELETTRPNRRQQRLQNLRVRYSADVLADARVRNELRNHARRMAFLHRAELIANTELEEPKKSQVLSRVKKLVDREEARHGKRMDHLRSNAGPAGSGPGPRGSGSAGPPRLLPAPKGSAQ